MISVDGLVETLARMATVETEIVLGAESGLHDAADKLRAAWVANIESEGLVLTGRYRDSVTATVGAGTASVHTEVPYAPILEHGDSRMAAHPVAQRAFDEHGTELVEMIGDRVREVVR